jgi:hypothetical protein
MGHARAVSFAVLCKECGQRTPKVLAWLTVHNEMTCGQCGALIDLSAGDNAVTIQKLSRECADLDTTVSKSN